MATGTFLAIMLVNFAIERGLALGWEHGALVFIAAGGAFVPLWVAVVLLAHFAIDWPFLLILVPLIPPIAWLLARDT